MRPRTPRVIRDTAVYRPGVEVLGVGAWRCWGWGVVGCWWWRWWWWSGVVVLIAIRYMAILEGWMRVVLVVVMCSNPVTRSWWIPLGHSLSADSRDGDGDIAKHQHQGFNFKVRNTLCSNS